MTTDTRRREILVPIDIRGINRTALEAVVTMAQRLDTSLLGLFVEDIFLQQVAELPFTTEVVRSSGAERDLYADTLKRRNRELVYTVEARFSEFATSRRVRFRFDYTSGRRTPAALERSDCDIFFPGRRTPRGARHAVQGEYYHRVKLVYDDSPQSQRALEILHALVKNGHTREIFVIAERRVPRTLLSGLAESGARVYLDNTGLSEHNRLQRMLGNPACDLVLLPRDSIASTPRDVLESAFERAAGSVLLLNG